ncbi:M20 family peptidase [soil metagenome]
MTTDQAVQHLRELVRIPTVSRADESRVEWEHFDAFVAAVARLYPLVHSRLELELVGHTMLFRWPGGSPGDPVLLMGHYDVVAAEDAGWEHPPFAAELTGEGDEQLLWGRGAIDDKGAVVAILEAVERQLGAGLVPRHDVYLSFGHDEETGGTGAKAVAELFASRGIRPAFVLDEGGAIVEGAFPGVSAPIAVVGVSEKGMTVVRLVVEQAGGHASTPPKVTATTRLARAVVRVGANPFPAGLNPAVMEMFGVIGKHARGAIGFAFRNARLLRPVLLVVFRGISDETAAMTRTTAAVTMLEAGLAENALAERATATISLRVAIGSTVADAVEHLRRAIRDDRVAIEVIQPAEPSPISPSSGAAWDALAATVERTHPGVVVTPYAQTGGTDSRQFTGLSRNVYRFTPFELSKAERDALHAVNERIHVATWLHGIEFYAALLKAL